MKARKYVRNSMIFGAIGILGILAMAFAVAEKRILHFGTNVTSSTFAAGIFLLYICANAWAFRFDKTSLIMRWPKITGLSYEDFPLEKEARGWMVKSKWAETAILFPLAKEAQINFDVREGVRADLKDVESNQPKVPLEVSHPQQFSKWREKTEEERQAYQSRLIIAKANLKFSEQEANKNWKKFLKAWDFFKELLETTPDDPKTGKPYEGKDAPKRFMQSVAGRLPTEAAEIPAVSVDAAEAPGLASS